jgi:ATP:ADP antiporter, AAA family
VFELHALLGGRLNSLSYFCSSITTCRYYPLFGMMANVALIFSGQYVNFVSSLSSTTISTINTAATTGSAMVVDPWGRSLKLLMGAVVASGAIIMSLMAYMQTQVLTDPACVDLSKEAKRKKQKTTMSVGKL